MKEINPEELNINPFEDIKNDWFLITAKKHDYVNTMTASWGMVGNMWGKPSVMIVIRESRYTKEFVDSGDCFSICFFEGYKKELGYLGKVSGRDCDKIKDCNLTVDFIDGVPYFKEASKVLICQKSYQTTIKDKDIIDSTVMDRWYPTKDMHDIYFGYVLKAFVKK